LRRLFDLELAFQVDCGVSTRPDDLQLEDSPLGAHLQVVSPETAPDFGSDSGFDFDSDFDFGSASFLPHPPSHLPSPPPAPPLHLGPGNLVFVSCLVPYGNDLLLYSLLSRLGMKVRLLRMISGIVGNWHLDVSCRCCSSIREYVPHL
jgi:hypothetical protein